MSGLEELRIAAIGEVVERSLVSPGDKQENVCQLTSRGVVSNKACWETGGLKRGQGAVPDGRSEDRRQEARWRLLAE